MFDIPQHLFYYFMWSKIVPLFGKNAIFMTTTVMQDNNTQNVFVKIHNFTHNTYTQKGSCSHSEVFMKSTVTLKMAWDRTEKGDSIR